jgi:hypothetical protein
MDLSQATTEVYFERLRKYDAQQIMRAVDLAIERSKFFPAVAELLENINSAQPARSKLLDAPRPSKDEAAKILASISEMIHRLEDNSLLSDTKRLEERRKLLRKQAEQLGVKAGK